METGTVNGKAFGGVTTLVKRSSTAVLGQMVKGVVVYRAGEAVFAVQKSEGSGKWALLKHVRKDADEAWREQVARDHPTFYPLQAQHGLFTTLRMLDDPEFKPTTARRVAADRVELDYRYRLPANDQGNRTEVVGTLTLATDKEWAVVRSVSHAAVTPAGFPIDSVAVREVERVGDVLQAKSFTLDFLNGDTKQAINTRKYTYKYRSSETVNPAEFTLEYYDLTAPEHDVYEDQPGFNWPLWGGVGLGCIALSVFLAWLIRRKRRQA